MLQGKRIIILLHFLVISTTTIRAKEIQVPIGHPRVYLHKEDIPKIKEKLKSHDFQLAREEIYATINSTHTEDPWVIAFYYLLTDSSVLARNAIEQGLVELKETTENRKMGNKVQAAACIYDWCYAHLQPEEKQQYQEEFIRIAKLNNPGYPASKKRMNAVCGHDIEGSLLSTQLPAGLAIYDECPTMFDSANVVFQDLVIPVINFYSQAHMHHQGDSYSANRFAHEILAVWLYKAFGYDQLVSPNQQFVPYQYLYHQRPDKRQFKSGDTYDDAGKAVNKKFCALLAGCFYDDPYLLEYWLDQEREEAREDYYYIFELIFRSENMYVNSSDPLPLTKYFPEPMGEMIARTGWNFSLNTNNDAVALMRIGGTLFGNHQCKDWGIFQIYYQGILALSSGVYCGDLYGKEHWLHYRHATISHNGLLIFDEAEATDCINGKVTLDGGQRWPGEIIFNQDFDPYHPKDVEVLKNSAYTYGSVTARDFGPDKLIPEYSYIAGDITNAYSNKKVEKVSRTMVCLNTMNATYPMIFMTFDYIAATNPSFPQKWLIHSIPEPVISDNTISIVQNTDDIYHGKLIVKSLLPPEPCIEKIGGPGKEFWVNGKNYAVPDSLCKQNQIETGNWRIEVSPSSPQRANHFFHVMITMDATTEKIPEIKQIETENLVGIKILNRAVLFLKNDALSRKLLQFQLDGQDKIKVLIIGLKAGPWTIRINSSADTVMHVCDEKKSLYLEITPGLVELDDVQASPITNQDQTNFKIPATLSQNYPNPFYQNTLIQYELFVPSYVHLSIFNVNGQLVREIINTRQSKGTYSKTWNGMDETNSFVPSGIYFIRLKADGHESIRKITLLK